MMPYIEMMVFDASSQTDNKLRWHATLDGVEFKLYIPKWRVPEPWPRTIAINLSPRREMVEDSPNLSREVVEQDPTVRAEPIVATVRRVSDHTETTRYDPVGDPREWEIGSPYIPHSLTFGKTEFVRFIVMWDLASRGEFHSQSVVRNPSE
jgi:hypothetical protein